VEVKLGLVRPLAQRGRGELRALARGLVLSIDPRLQRVGRFLNGLLLDKQRGNEYATDLFREFREDVLLDRLFEVEVLAKAEEPEVRLRVARDISRIQRRIGRPQLAARLESIRSTAGLATAVGGAKTRTA
jgi:hypothetical protein